MNKFAYITGLLSLLSVPATASAQTFDEHVNAGYAAFLNYNFQEAAKQYNLAKKKAKKTTNTSTLENYQHRLSMAQNFLERVEKLVILDSIAVPKAEFFKAYKLPVSAGALAGDDALPTAIDGVNYVFTNEGKDFKMWAQPDSVGTYQAMEAIRLTNGEWNNATELPEEINNGHNTIYPFMMADGVTLYFANEGEESIGGYDIFVATRDAATGEYLQPQNIGMPYNSPFDDYMLAIDELNGVGWWATDRNQLGDDITIYLFKVNDLRANYDPNEDDVESFARIADYRATQDEEEDYTELLETINSITQVAEKKIDFYFPMKGGITYTSLADFNTTAGKTAMKKYLSAKKTLDSDLEKLSALRKKYSVSASSSVKTEIKNLEASTERQRESLKKLCSEVYKAECK